MAEYRRKNRDEDIDDLLLDVKYMIHDGEAAEEEQEMPRNANYGVGDETRVWMNREDSIIAGAAANAEKTAQDYARYEQVYVDEPEPIERQPSILAYNNDFADRKNMKTAGKKRSQAQKAAQVRRIREARANAAADYEDPRNGRYDPYDGQEEETPSNRPPKKRGCGCGCGLTLLLIMALLAALVFGAVKLLGKFADAGEKERRPGVSNVLVAGVDAEGLRTDVLMLVSVDKTEKTYNILSIPRDTLVDVPYAVPKINGAYGYYGCGEEGMEEVMELVEDCIGFEPDKYIVVDFDAVSELVDIMGGIRFDVPMDMSVDGVELREGSQRLDGEEALAVLRFRAGYALADLERVAVQRELISAAMDQWISLKNLKNLPDAISCLKENTVSDLDVWNLASLMIDLRGCEAGVNETLPGSAQMIGDGSYYVLDPEAVAELINEHFNPYKRNIKEKDLDIKVG